MGEIRRKDPCLLSPNVRSVVCSLMVAFTFSFRVSMDLAMSVCMKAG